MKITVTLDEIRKLVEAELVRRGLPIKPSSSAYGNTLKASMTIPVP